MIPNDTGVVPSSSPSASTGTGWSASMCSWLAREEVTRLGLPPRTAARLVQRYGDDWPEAARLIGADASLGEPVADGLPVLGVEVALARSREMALTDEDIVVRRTRLTTRDGSVRLTPSGG